LTLSAACEIILCTLVVGAMGLMGNHLIYALLTPANNTITTKLTDALNSITSNVSTSIQSDIDKVISDTMDITINNVMSQLSNATILGNNEASSIDLADVSLPVSNEFASLDK
jgi:proline dehydrogenase